MSVHTDIEWQALTDVIDDGVGTIYVVRARDQQGRKWAHVISPMLYEIRDDAMLDMLYEDVIRSDGQRGKWR
jgi:hypothetical protein